MANESRKISEEKTGVRWPKMIAALLTSRTQQEACRKARVPASTLADWLRDPRFVQEYRTARQILYERVTGKLPAIADEAVERLRDILHDPNATIREQLTAVRITLEFAQGSVSADMDSLHDELQRLLAKHGKKK